ANAGKMPAATHASTVSLYQGSKPSPPQELLTMSGARSGRGFSPLASVGASTHWPAASSEASVQVLNSQPLAAIQRAPGATPMPFAPTIVPMTWVPWSLLSHGAAVGQIPAGSNQL